MKKKFLCAFAAIFATSLLGCGTAFAQNGQPHSLTADVSFTDVRLNWKKPTDAITLQWHDGDSYNGTDGKLDNPEGSITYYVASKFSANDLDDYAGLSVDSIAYYEYRPVYKASVLVYENGELVAEQEAQLDNFKKDSWRTVRLQTPYKIKAGKSVMFAVKFTVGRNLDFVAICDKAPHKGKGNLYSYDGETWNDDAPGDYLITAYLHNNATTTPDGYNVYRNAHKVNPDLITDATSYEMKGEAEGYNTYTVSACYGGVEKNSTSVKVNLHSAYHQLPPVVALSDSVSNLKASLSWLAPLKRGPEMTWSNKVFAQAIGGTSKSNPVVWIKQDFSVADLAAFPNHQITAVNAFVGPENGISDATLFVMKNGKIDYSEAVSAAAVSAIVPNAWNKFTLNAPYKMELGNAYAFGICYHHEVDRHPVGVDNGVAVPSKGNAFSTSSISSKGFDKTKPSWKTLSAGNIPGNFMLTADVEGLSEEATTPQTVSSYEVYRNDELIATNVRDTHYVDSVSELGTYRYAVVARNEEAYESPATSLDVTYSLPSEYAAPIIVNYAQNGKDVSFSWSSSAYNMQHYNTPAVMTGFDEEIAMLYGAKFSKEELSPYVGYSINSLKFAIGANIGTFKMEIRTSDNAVLYSKEYQEGQIEPGYIYKTTFDENEQVVIPADKDLYLVYNATLPAGAKALVLDGGPAIEGGAMVSLTGGASWMKLGTIASSLKDYNLVVSAMAVSSDASADSKAVTLVQGHVAEARQPFPVTYMRELTVGNVDLNVTEDPYGIASVTKLPAVTTKAVKAPKVTSYRVYRNGQLVSASSANTYNEHLDGYGVFNYNVTSVYANGWESAPSAQLTFKNIVSQREAAPYDLRGEAQDGTLKLSWKAPEEAPELTYQTGNEDIAIGMTGSSTREGYHAIKFSAEELADKVGQEVSHIKFKLADNDVLSASVFVMYGDNIMYEQDLDLDSVKKGWNDVTLNTPVAIVAGQDVSVGYHLTYQPGKKPMVCDNGEAVAGYGDLISSSASAGYWYSLATKFKVNHNWRIAAVLKTADRAVQLAKAAEGISFNVYCDGQPIANGITETTYDVTNAASGVYTVTAVKAGKETGASNSVSYDAATSISAIVTTDEALAADKVFTLDGRCLGSAATIGTLPKGIYIVGNKKVVK